MIYDLKNFFLTFYYCFMAETNSDSTLLPETSSSESCFDDWDTIDPEIIKKRLEERKKVEEADNELTNELFDDNVKKQKHSSFSTSPKLALARKAPIKRNKLKIDVNLINESYKYEKQSIKNAKKELERKREIFGESHDDEIGEMSDDLQDKYEFSLRKYKL